MPTKAEQILASYNLTPQQALNWMEANPNEVGGMAESMGLTITDLADVATASGMDVAGLDLNEAARIYNMPPPPPAATSYQPAVSPVAPVTAAPATRVSPQVTQAQELAGVGYVSPVSPAPSAPSAPPAVAERTSFASYEDWRDYYGLTDQQVAENINSMGIEGARDFIGTLDIADKSGFSTAYEGAYDVDVAPVFEGQLLGQAAPTSFANIQEYLDYHGVSEDQAREFLQGASPAEVSRFFMESGIQDLPGFTEYATRLTGRPYSEATIDPRQADIFQPGQYPTSVSRTGLPQEFTGPLLEGILPQLQQATADLPGQVGEWTEQAKALSQSASRNLLQGAMTNVMADLAKRGVLKSSVAERAIGRAGAGVATQLGQQMAQIGMQGATLRSQVPGILAGVAGLGQVSEARQEDPLAPYNLYSQFIQSMR